MLHWRIHQSFRSTGHTSLPLSNACQQKSLLSIHSCPPTVYSPQATRMILVKRKSDQVPLSSENPQTSITFRRKSAAPTLPKSSTWFFSPAFPPQPASLCAIPHSSPGDASWLSPSLPGLCSERPSQITPLERATPLLLLRPLALLCLLPGTCLVGCDMCVYFLLSFSSVRVKAPEG